jgi:hypothetical protein
MPLWICGGSSPATVLTTLKAKNAANDNRDNLNALNAHADAFLNYLPRVSNPKQVRSTRMQLSVGSSCKHDGQGGKQRILRKGLSDGRGGQAVLPITLQILMAGGTARWRRSERQFLDGIWSFQPTVRI